jgi:PucR C-terminal helix-turn-helix domain/GGDEF-like domain
LAQTFATAPTRASRVGIEEIVAAMSAELDDVARSLTDTIHEHLEELDDELHVGTLQSVRSNLGVIMTMLHEGTEPSRAVPPPEALAYAKEYARRGLGFEVLRRAYRTAQAAFTRMWLERLRRASVDPDSFAEAVGFFNDWMFSWMDTLERQLIEPYMQERERWIRGTAALRAEQVRAIVDGGRVDVTEASSRLGYELRREHLAYVIYRDGAEGLAEDWEIALHDMERLAAGVAEAVGARSQLAIPLGGHLACWAGLREDGALDDLGARLDVPSDGLLRVAVGSPGHGLEGFRRSHREALLAGRAAEVLGYGSCGYVQFAESALDVLLSQDVEEARRFVERELGPLAADSASARRLVLTLRAFFEEGASYVRAARRLDVHENTIAYRVQRAEELLGHPVAERRLELQVALRLVSLVGA